jgi:hypothetical protein
MDCEASTGTNRHHSWSLAHRRVRFVTPVFALLVVGVLGAACGRDPTPSGVASVGSAPTTSEAPASNSGGPPPSAETQALLKFSECVRAHGVPDFPDPRASGGFPDSARAYEEMPRYQAAQNACNADAIASGVIHSPTALAQHLKQLSAEDACIRKHGVPNMPGPTPQGEQMFPEGITPRSPQLQAASRICAYLNP